MPRQIQLRHNPNSPSPGLLNEAPYGVSRKVALTSAGQGNPWPSSTFKAQTLIVTQMEMQDVEA